MKTILAIDADKNACTTFSANFPEAHVLHRRVVDCISMLPSVDIVTGGFPCQPHSVAGKRMVSKDERDGGDDFVDAIRKVQPRQFMGENVPGILTSENGVYVQRLMDKMQNAGYVVEIRTLCASAYGVPQFRRRVWFWGIRKDLYGGGMRHCWPRPTHAWPWPEPGMFGDHGLARAVTVGQALNIPHRQVDGVWYGGDATSKVMGGGSHPALRKGKESARDITGEPCTTLNKEAHHGDNSPTVLSWDQHEQIAKAMGAKLSGRYDHGEADMCAPCPTIKAVANVDASGHQGGACPPAIAYRWSDEMLAKHPPASPASPASTVQAKWFKGGAEGLVEIEVDTKQPRTSTPVSTLGIDSRHRLTANKKTVRRLTVAECQRLQSMPDNFIWPSSVSKTARYKIIGNGQASLMTHVLAQAMKRADPESETVIDLYCGGGVGACGMHGRYWPAANFFYVIDSTIASDPDVIVVVEWTGTRDVEQSRPPAPVDMRITCADADIAASFDDLPEPTPRAPTPWHPYRRPKLRTKTLHRHMRFLQRPNCLGGQK